MTKFSIYNYYHSLNRDEKIEFKNDVISKCGITKGAFYNWITRDMVPKRDQINVSELVIVERVDSDS